MASRLVEAKRGDHKIFHGGAQGTQGAGQVWPPRLPMHPPVGTPQGLGLLGHPKAMPAGPPRKEGALVGHPKAGVAAAVGWLAIGSQ